MDIEDINDLRFNKIKVVTSECTIIGFIKYSKTKWLIIYSETFGYIYINPNMIHSLLPLEYKFQLPKDLKFGDKIYYEFCHNIGIKYIGFIKSIEDDKINIYLNEMKNDSSSLHLKEIFSLGRLI